MNVCKKCSNYELELDDMQERCLAGNDLATADGGCKDFRASAGRKRKGYYDAVMWETLNEQRGY